MPYITKEIRGRVLREGATDGAELAYSLYVDITDYWIGRGRSYKAITEIRGALHAALTEFDRRIAFPYEDEKIKENGDV